ncbi:MAG: L-histidine N(alpha)-methyltransferase [Pyrinomonadaceae bacterium]
MQNQTQSKLGSFAGDVRRGLSATPKFLSSKYFYDDAGSRLFQQIMDLPEYYLTRTEAEIFSSQKKEITESFTAGRQSFDLIELGAGDGAKTSILIDYFLSQKIDFTYSPVDISGEAIETLTTKFRNLFPDLSIKPRRGDYFHILETLKTESARAKIILFLGSNIGNFSRASAIAFFKQLRAVINEKDLLFVGFDLQKNPSVILDAYNDKQGVTAAFNLNLLTRVNRELGADFDIRKFFHYAAYNPAKGAARSFLMSGEEQKVSIKSLNQEFYFKKWEPVYMEISQKYTPEMIEQFAAESGFEIVRNFFDREVYFVDSLWKTL